MILVNFLEKIEVFDDCSDALSEIKKRNLHPDIIDIFKGDFMRLDYNDLLTLCNKPDLDIEKINKEIAEIKDNMLNNFKNTDMNDLILKHTIYNYGPAASSYLLDYNFNPVCEFLIKFKINNNVFSNIDKQIDTSKIRKIVNKSLNNEWELLKVKKGKNESVSMGYVWMDYTIFIMKKREKLEVF